MFLELREAESLPDRLRTVIPSVYTDDFIQDYLKNNSEIDKTAKKNFEALLRQVGIDLQYMYFLNTYSSKDDKFGIVIDRDYDTHTVQQIREIKEECDSKGFELYLTTPLIEFWLLLHLVDIKAAYPDDMENFRTNDKVSANHTFTSQKVSELAHHKKKITENSFRDYYLSKVDFAIEQTRKYFTTDLDLLIGDDSSEDSRKGQLGSNLPDLFALLRSPE